MLLLPGAVDFTHDTGVLQSYIFFYFIYLNISGKGQKPLAMPVKSVQ